MARHDDLSNPRGTPGGPTVDRDAFGRFAERLARFLGTGRYLFVQTLIVIVWIAINVFAGVKGLWDKYPFILLNLLFSTQAAYAAPLILLAQNRQADRDKAHSEADAQHREDLALASQEREIVAAQETAKLLELMRQNTELTELVRELSQRIETLTNDLHCQLIKANQQSS